MKYKVFISQPMAGRTLDEVLEERMQIINILNGLSTCMMAMDVEIEIIESFEANRFNANTKPLEGLGGSIQKMQDADIVVFAPGWEQSKGCKVEHLCATEYGLSLIHLKDTKPLIKRNNNDVK